MRKLVFSSLLFFLLYAPTLFPKTTYAYTDYSIYRIETGDFFGEENVKNALATLKAGTGWWATYEPTGKSIPYYQVSSGGFYGEQNVIDKLNQFQASTGLTGTYKPIGNPEPYRQVVAGSFYGESNTQNIVKSFTDETGLNAKYEPVGAGINKKRIIAGAFVGEENVKNAVQAFQSDTGISATYQPTGQYQEYVRVVSGGFNGEDNTKSILQKFISNTGLNATYEPINSYDYYKVSTGAFAGEENVKAIVNQIGNDLGISVTYVPAGSPNLFNINFPAAYGDSLNKIINYLTSKSWWYSKTPTGTKVATTFRIVSDPIVDKVMINKALDFFKSNNWWAGTSSTGTKVYNQFNIISDPILDQETINKGLNFFARKNWWATTQTTSEKGYVYFNVVTDPYLEKENINKAVNYFKSKNWWNTTVTNSKTGYTTFQIVSDPLLGQDKNDQALTFFSDNDWWASSKPTGNKEDYYKIVTGGFQGYDNAVANAQMVTDRFGWRTSIVKLVNGPQVTSTNYNLTLAEMINKEMQLTIPPQTDKYKNDPAYVSTSYIDKTNNKVTVDSLNVRGGPGTNYNIVATITKGTIVTILGTQGDWTKIALTWKNATFDDIAYALNPNNFSKDGPEYFQFIKLSKPANTNINEVNEKILNDNAGVLKGTASAFAQAASLYGVNELYLISHALHETGNGKSLLATGVVVNGKKVYNMYGYGAYDTCPVDCGAQTAYDQAWFTPEAAIIGGAKLISSGYIYNTTFQQDTLYKMRWNPVVTYHQYATDVGWALKQVPNLYNYYHMLDNYTLYIDLPVFK